MASTVRSDMDRLRKGYRHRRSDERLPVSSVTRTLETLVCLSLINWLDTKFLRWDCMAYIVVYLVLSISHLISASCSWGLQYPNGTLFQSFSVQWNSRKSRYQIYFTSNMDHAQPVRKTARKKKMGEKNGKCGRKNVVSCLKWIFFQIKHEATHYNIKKKMKKGRKKKENR